MQNNCDKCEAKFAKRRLLVHHLKTVHYIATAEKYYSCNFCSRKFVKKPSLWGHLAEHTSGEQVGLVTNQSLHYGKVSMGGVTFRISNFLTTLKENITFTFYFNEFCLKLPL